MSYYTYLQNMRAKCSRFSSELCDRNRAVYLLLMLACVVLLMSTAFESSIYAGEGEILMFVSLIVLYYTAMLWFVASF